MKSNQIVTLALTCVALWLSSSVAHADCLAAAKSALKKAANTKTQDASLDGKPVKGTTKCGDGEACQVVRFHQGKTTTTPQGADGFAASGGWQAVPDADKLGCAGLEEFVFVRTAATDKPPAKEPETSKEPVKPAVTNSDRGKKQADNTSELTATAADQSRARLRRVKATVKATTATRTEDQHATAVEPPSADDSTAHKEALEAFKLAPHSYSSLPGGQAQGGSEEAVAEALQILAQIVVDRASAKGYDLLRSKFQRALRCSDSSRFTATCAALATLRLQDVAMAPDVIATALSQDLLALLEAGRIFPAPFPKQPTSTVAPSATSDLLRARPGASMLLSSLATPAVPPAAAPGAVQPQPSAPTAQATSANPEDALEKALFAVARALLTKSGQSADLALKQALAALTDYVAAQDPGAIGGLTPAQQAAVFGVLGFARCGADSDGTSNGLLNCVVEDELAELHVPDVVKPAAAQLAHQLVTVVGASSTTPQRLELDVDSVAETACMIIANAPTPALACPQVEDLTSLTGNAVPAFVQAFADAALEKNTMRFVVVAAALVDLLMPSSEIDPGKGDAWKRELKTTLRLLGGVLTYAATFAKPTDPSKAPSEQDLHAQRTKILESMTEDMSDRTGRDRDWIVSLGGALRVLGGVRLGLQAKGHAIQGPLSLPLGIALTQVPATQGGVGFHMQLNAVDLGNYLAFEEGPTVKKPNVADVVAVGLSVGAGFGQSLPITLTAEGSYTPQFKLDPSKPEKQGTINVGLAVGIHVPLIDLN